MTNTGDKSRLTMREWHASRVALILLMTVCSGSWSWTDVSGQSISVTGYWKNYSTALHQPDITGLLAYENRPLMGSVSNRVRLMGHFRMSGVISMTAAYDVSPRIQDRQLFDQSLPVVGIYTPPYRAEDFDDRLYPDDDDVQSFAVYHNLDRLVLTVRFDWADLYLGRQAIAWGAARIINPTDVFIPFAFNELDVEDRVGVDAVRVRVPVGALSEIDTGFLIGDEFKMANSAWYLRGRHYLLRSDVSGMIIGFRKNLMVGIDIARAIGGAGVWFEAAQVFVGALDSPHEKTGDDYFRGSIGCDYSLKDGTYLFLEYHYNQAGESDAGDYLRSVQSAAYSDGAVYLLGEHYLAPGAIYQLTPLVALSTQVLANLNDPSAYIMTSAEYNITENMYLSGGTYVGMGENPLYRSDLDVPFGSLELRSEFGLYPDLFFTSFRVYF